MRMRALIEVHLLSRRFHKISLEPSEVFKSPLQIIEFYELTKRYRGFQLKVLWRIRCNKGRMVSIVTVSINYWLLKSIHTVYRVILNHVDLNLNSNNLTMSLFETFMDGRSFRKNISFHGSGWTPCPYSEIRSESLHMHLVKVELKSLRTFECGWSQS